VAAKVPAQYVVPQEGAEYWIDAYAIPVGAKNLDAAHKWINFVYRSSSAVTRPSMRAT